MTESFLRGPCLFVFSAGSLWFYFNVIGSFIKKVWHPLFPRKTSSLVHFSSFQSGSNNLAASSASNTHFAFSHVSNLLVCNCHRAGYFTVILNSKLL